MQYQRRFADDEKEAAWLFFSGYRQISNKFGIVARIDVPDLVAALKKRCRSLRRINGEDGCRKSIGEGATRKTDWRTWINRL